MNNFPPTTPDDRQSVTGKPDTVQRSRRRGATSVALTAGVLIGGLVAGSQFADASSSAASTGDTPSEAVAIEPDIDANLPGPVESPESATPPRLGCFDDRLDSSFGPDDQPEVADAADTATVSTCIAVAAESDGADLQEWQAFDTCLDEQLGDLGTAATQGWFTVGDAEGTVSVDVRVDGDVTTLDASTLDNGPIELGAEWAQAHEECRPLLPDGAFDMGTVQEVGDLGFMDIGPIEIVVPSGDLEHAD